MNHSAKGMGHELSAQTYTNDSDLFAVGLLNKFYFLLHIGVFFDVQDRHGSAHNKDTGIFFGMLRKCSAFCDIDVLKGDLLFLQKLFHGPQVLVSDMAED